MIKKTNNPLANKNLSSELPFVIQKNGVIRVKPLNRKTKGGYKK